jgi:hypothetical protein
MSDNVRYRASARRLVGVPTDTELLFTDEMDRLDGPRLDVVWLDCSARFRSHLSRFVETCRANPAGGARRDRTDDLLLAKQALSQLSYGPIRDQVSVIRHQEGMALFLIPDC